MPRVNCSVVDCDRLSDAKGMCNMHYLRVRAHGDPLVVIDQSRKPCSVDGCQVLARYSQMCVKHFRRVQSNGDPDVTRSGGRPLNGDVPSSAAIHKRIRRLHGAARLRSCVDCGKRAAEWSYDNADVGELIDAKTGSPYSLDISHYAPRCVPCHRIFDNAIRAAA